MGTLQRIRRRIDCAGSGLVLLIAHFLVAPMLHLLDHRSDHSHRPGGGIEWHALAHAHGETHAHGEPSGPRTEGAHGKGATEHFGSITIEIATFIGAAPPTTLTLLTLPCPGSLCPEIPLRRAHGPRGPPLHG